MDWSKLQHFSRYEPFGDPDRMDEDLLIALDHFRHIIGYPFQIMAGFAKTGHSENSYHYLGRAIDGRFTHQDGSALSLSVHIMIALKAPFNGVGIYTWGAGGPFLHLDNRISPERKIWVSEKEGEYKNLSSEFLRQYLS